MVQNKRWVNYQISKQISNQRSLKLVYIMVDLNNRNKKASIIGILIMVALIMLALNNINYKASIIGI